MVTYATSNTGSNTQKKKQVLWTAQSPKAQTEELILDQKPSDSNVQITTLSCGLLKKAMAPHTSTLA